MILPYVIRMVSMSIIIYFSELVLLIKTLILASDAVFASTVGTLVTLYASGCLARGGSDDRARCFARSNRCVGSSRRVGDCNTARTRRQFKARTRTLTNARERTARWSLARHNDYDSGESDDDVTARDEEKAKTAKS
jgi:hypothetical protein